MKPHLPEWVSTQEGEDTGWFREGQSCVDGAGGKYLQVPPVCRLQRECRREGELSSGERLEGGF